MSKTVVVVAGKRTPFGAFGGGLKDVSATDLAVAAGKATLGEINMDPKEIDHIVLGNVVQAGSDAIYVPRHTGLKLGIPEEVPALGINRLCGSGFQAWSSAAQMIQTDEASVVLAGGTEQMSQVPYVVRGARWGQRMGHGEIEDFLFASLTDQYTGLPMAITAENLADKYKISRKDCEEYSILSQNRFDKAVKNGSIAQELCKVEVSTRKGKIIIEKDEHPKPGTTLEGLAKLRPVFKKDGMVTAGTASGIVDGAALSVLMSEDEAKKRGLKPRVKILGWASVGCDPAHMGIGPVPAIRKVLKTTGFDLKQMDLVEINEAFAPQYLACEKELGLDRRISNVNGSSIAVGHPLAATGTRIMNHLIYELERQDKRYGLGSACIGGGQGMAILIER